MKHSVYHNSHRAWKRVHKTYPNVAIREYSDGYMAGWKAAGRKSNKALYERALDAAQRLLNWEQESDFINGFLCGYRAAKRSKRK